MAELTGKYVIHPSGDITAGQLAALYGLSGGEYITADSTTIDQHTWHLYIHLYVREDGKYRNIKQLLGDYDDQPYYDKATKRNREYYRRSRNPEL